ncbi:hypothetical protein C8J56DRAFT_427278 [Mycena floridula]|nr:hypothetical protein C8J56DRAFT_427278 [Mycena floridula]
MPAPAPFPSPFPALYLYPINDSFIPKHISLLHNQRVKIGRQTNAKTTPGERNGFFDSKVLSRQHAEVWEEGNKIFLKDVKSSNGTFINGDRLSAEGVESEPYELKSDDIVEFGIDIVGEDNKTVIHHKVAARVVCIFNEQDVQMASRAEQHQLQQMQQQQQYSQSQSPSTSSSMMNQAGPSSASNPAPSTYNFAPNQPQQQRRPPIGHQGLTGMGGMGGSMRPPGKSGLTFDHILSRLQGELQKSRETGAELHTLTGAMHDIHDTIGGGLPPNMAPYSHNLPPVRPQQAGSASPSQSEQQTGAPGPSSHEQSNGTSYHSSATSSSSGSSPNSSLLSELQSQLQDTQSSLAQHVEKIRSLEAALKEQEVIRHEVSLLKDMMDVVRRKDLGAQKRLRGEDHVRGGFDAEDDEEVISEEEDMDDSMSISTVVPHQLERVDEVDEDGDSGALFNGIQDEPEEELSGEESMEKEQEAEQDERRRRHDELGRPRTPEPGMGLGDRYDSRMRSKTLTAKHSPISPSHLTNGISVSVIDDLTARLATLSSQLESALELSSTLQAQHTSAQVTISTLESKVEALEGMVKMTLTTQWSNSEPPPPVAAAPEQVESLTFMMSEWKKSVEGQWSNVQEEWTQERARLSRAREEWENKARLVDSGLEKLERMQRSAAVDRPAFNGNGEAVKDLRHHHSGGLATPPSPRSRSSDSSRTRRRKSGSRGRSGSRKRSLSNEVGRIDTSKLDGLTAAFSELQNKDLATRSLATPEPSVRTIPSGFSLPSSPASDSSPMAVEKRRADAGNINLNVHTAIGVLVLSVAAVAVAWRVKPE